MSYFRRTILQGTNDAGNISNIPVDSYGHMEVALHGPRLPFGTIDTTELYPLLQVDAVYGINTQSVVTTTGGGGTATAANNLFTVGNGNTTAGSLGTIQSRKRIRYRPGQGLIGRFTGLFSTGQTNVYQLAGIGTAESGYYFGYNGTRFGILHVRGGVREIQTLTVSAGAGGAETVTITLANTQYTVNVTSGTATNTAYQISQGTFAGWKAQQRGATVIFVADSAANQSGTFSLSSTGTTAGTFAETLAGATSTDAWTYQEDWDDPCDGTGPSGFVLDPTKGNVYQIDVEYLGFGAITFKIEAADENNNPEWIPVHTLRFPNSRTSVSITQPAFPFTMACYNIGAAGGTATVSCASFAGMITGQKVLNGPRLSYVNTVTSSTSAFTPIFTVRNSYVFGGRANQTVLNVQSVSGSANGNASALTVFYLIRNATLSAGTPNFASYATTSASDYDTGATTCTFSTNDQLLWSGAIAEDGSFEFAFTDDIMLQPGETLTLAVRSITATAACVGALNTREDQ